MWWILKIHMVISLFILALLFIIYNTFKFNITNNLLSLGKCLEPQNALSNFEIITMCVLIVLTPIVRWVMLLLFYLLAFRPDVCAKLLKEDKDDINETETQNSEEKNSELEQDEDCK